MARQRDLGQQKDNAVADLEDEPIRQIGHGTGSRRENHTEDQQQQDKTRGCKKLFL